MKSSPLLAVALGLAFTLAVAAGEIPSPESSQSVAGQVNVVDYGALGDGRTDNTAAFQRAIDALTASGGKVLIPVGQFLVKGSVTIKDGVTLAGLNETSLAPGPLKGSVILATGGRDDEAAMPLFVMESSTAVRGLTIFYPDQKAEDIHPYPWSISMNVKNPDEQTRVFDCVVEKITLINSYNGIQVGPAHNGRHRIYEVYGCALRRGIRVDNTRDIGRIENIHLHCVYWRKAVTNGNWDKAFGFMQTNLEAFVFGRTDWEYVNNTFVFPAKVGYRFIETPDGACNGQFAGIGADATETCVVIESLQPQGLLISNGEFNSHRVGRSTQVVVEKNCRGNIRFVNCGFWGPVEQNVVLEGPSFLSFTDCYFSNDYATTNYSVVASAGKLQVQNCTFDARSKQRKPGNAWTQADVRKQPGSVWLKPGLEHAVIRGNNGFYGVNIRNELGEKAILADNEPFRPATVSTAAPVKVILDTDNGPDCGDAGAVAVLHALADRREVEIIGMMACTSDPYNAPCLDAYNTYYGRPGIPVGTLKEPGFLAGPYYSERIAQHFPNALRHASNAPDATVLYRQLLAVQPDRGLSVVSIGPLRNLKNLLQSQADTNSPMNGRDLVAAKVKELSCMAAWFPAGKEWNVEQDPESARYVCEHWPTPIMFSGGELGYPLESGERLAKETPESNPVRAAYGGGSRPSWDQISVLYAARGLANYWGAVTNGYNRIEATASNVFETIPHRGHSYLVPRMNLDVMEKIIDDLMVGAVPGTKKPDYPPFTPEPYVPPTAESSLPAGGQTRTYAARNGELGGGATLNGDAVGNLHHAGAFLKIRGVDGGVGGKAFLKIRFATHDNATKSLFINGVRVAQLKFRFTGGWTTYKELVTAVNLVEGANNVIMIQNSPGDNAWGVNLEAITVTTYASPPGA